MATINGRRIKLLKEEGEPIHAAGLAIRQWDRESKPGHRTLGDE